MGLQSDIRGAFDSIALSLPDAAVTVVYQGQSVTGMAGKLPISAQSVPFADDSDTPSTPTTSKTYVKADLITSLKYGDKININNEDRFITRGTAKDAVGATWVIKHTEYYNEWATITGHIVEYDDSIEVYISLKCRLMDQEIDDFPQFEEDSTELKKRMISIRESDWIYNSDPVAGLTVEFETIDNMRVQSVEKVGGDYRITCRSIGDNG